MAGSTTVTSPLESAHTGNRRYFRVHLHPTPASQHRRRASQATQSCRSHSQNTMWHRQPQKRPKGRETAPHSRAETGTQASTRCREPATAQGTGPVQGLSEPSNRRPIPLHVLLREKPPKAPPVNGGGMLGHWGGVKLYHLVCKASVKVRANWPAEISQHGECDISAKRTGKATGSEQLAR